MRQRQGWLSQRRCPHASSGWGCGIGRRGSGRGAAPIYGAESQGQTLVVATRALIGASASVGSRCLAHLHRGCSWSSARQRHLGRSHAAAGAIALIARLHVEHCQERRERFDARGAVSCRTLAAGKRPRAATLGRWLRGALSGRFLLAAVEGVGSSDSIPLPDTSLSIESVASKLRSLPLDEPPDDLLDASTSERPTLERPVELPSRESAGRRSSSRNVASEPLGGISGTLPTPPAAGAVVALGRM